MFEGRVAAICIAEKKGLEPQEVAEVQALAGCGLAGDRFCRAPASGKPAEPDREVTLIEKEALDALAHECQLALAPHQARRNVVTHGVPLNHLVGKEFSVGDVILRGIRLCEPCDHLEKLTVAGVKDGLHHRGGLRAQIVRGGLLRTGDRIRPRESAP